MAVTLVEKTNPGLPIWHRGQPKGDVGERRAVLKVVEVTFDNSYLTGGEPIDLTAVELTSAFMILAPPAQGFFFAADLSVPTAPKLLAFQGDWPNAAVAPMIEVPNATNLATLVVRVLIFGVV